MRIAMIRSASSAVPKSQYNIQEIGLAKELAKLGMMVDVFLISDSGRTYCESMDKESMVTVYWMKGYKIPGQQGYYPDLIKILDHNSYELIQALDDSQITTVLASRYSKKKGIKFVLWQGMYENYPEAYKRIIQQIYDRTLLKALRNNTTYCIAKTTSAKSYLESKAFSPISVIPVALEVSNFGGHDNTDYRQKLGISEKQKILLYVGKVEKRRNPLFCLDVYGTLKKKHKDCCLVYVGKGPMLEETYRYAESQNLEDVHFIESIPQKELPGLYAISDMFLLPTRYEIFGMVLMEAMYFGTPVITYQAAGPVDIISNGKDGIVMESFDVDAWAESIERHIYGFHDSDQMGILGQRKISTKYLWPIVAKKYYDTYLSILGK